jgi:hypothetical protein
LTNLTTRLDSDSLQFDEDDLIGLDTQRAFLQQQLARIRKTQRFMAAASSSDKLMASALVLSFVERRIMSKYFKASRRFENNPGALLLVHRSRSPVSSVLSVLCGRLQSEGDMYWLPIIGERPWSESLYISAATPVWTMIGQLFLRFEVALRRWPWRLGLLVGDELSRDEKEDLARELLASCEHIDPFTEKFRLGMTTTEEVLSHASLQFLDDVFQNIPVSNLISEMSFAASHVRRQTTHGNEASVSTVASNHVLTVSKTNLGLQSPMQSSFAQHKKPVPKSAWQNFLKSKRSQMDMSDAAVAWQGIQLASVVSGAVSVQVAAEAAAEAASGQQQLRSNRSRAGCNRKHGCGGQGQWHTQLEPIVFSMHCGNDASEARLWTHFVTKSAARERRPHETLGDDLPKVNQNVVLCLTGIFVWTKGSMIDRVCIARTQTTWDDRASGPTS